MNPILKIAIFLAVNTIGFLMPPLCFIIGVRSGALNISDPGFDITLFRQHFVHYTYMTWMVCALFSLAFFFLKGKEKYFFLLAPVVIPAIYGLYIIFFGFGV